MRQWLPTTPIRAKTQSNRTWGIGRCRSTPLPSATLSMRPLSLIFPTIVSLTVTYQRSPRSTRWSRRPAITNRLTNTSLEVDSVTKLKSPRAPSLRQSCTKLGKAQWCLRLCKIEWFSRQRPHSTKQWKSSETNKRCCKKMRRHCLSKRSLHQLTCKNVELSRWSTSTPWRTLAPNRPVAAPCSSSSIQQVLATVSSWSSLANS